MLYARETSASRRWWQPKVIAIMLAVSINCIARSGRAEIAQVPLFLTVEVSPNILFVIDDSGSMHFETLPDEISMDTFGGTQWWHRGIFYMFPAADRIYGGTTDYWHSSTYRAANSHNVPGFDQTDPWAAYFRAHRNNPLYYNPEVHYRPWVDSEGTPWPDATPSAAYHNPANTAKGYRNLTTDNTQRACWINAEADTSSTNNNLCTTEDHTFYPATYFRYLGGDIHQASSYERIEIKPGNAPFAGGAGRKDCAAPLACTYDEEMQNFANWYSYHRSRILAARGGLGRAFAAQDDLIRVGYGAINAGSSTMDGEASPGTIVRGVRDFSGEDRLEFFDLLYNRPVPLAGTPLRQALDDAGRYYSRTDNRGPWSSTPGTHGGEDLECRNSYTILMTDGYWSTGQNPARHSSRRTNVDDQQGPVISNPDPLGADYQYSPEPPYRDNWPDTLADVAMYYWSRDLHPMANRVPTSVFNEAFWQNMVTFGVGLGVAGTLDPATDLPALQEGTLTWPDPTTDATPRGAKIDDLWHAALNSRGDFFSAMNPNVFSETLGELLSALVERKSGTAATIATNSTRLVDNTLIYQARFDSSDWSGKITAYRINADGTVGDPEWDTDGAGQIPPHDSRNIYTWDGSRGVEFTWNNLHDSQKSVLRNGGAEQQGIDRLGWIRGDRGKELGQSGGYLRTRSKVLGDIINSDPLVVGTPNFRYDLLPSGPAKDTYVDFRSSNRARTKMLYIGGNDGMLHAFDALTGGEKFAYVPNGVFGNLDDLASPDYTHKYFVDGSPFIGDAFIGGEWKTILVGSLGAGGRTVFALDVTDPDNFDESKVLWEFAHEDLGYTIGQPVVAYMKNGDWAAIFGNGYGSDNHKSQLFVVKLETGELIRRIDTGAGDSSNPNGLATPALLADSERTIEYAYAGDLLGNLWKFDLTHHNQPSQWDIAYTQGQNKYPLFQARNAAGDLQPITAPLEIGKHPDDGYMIYFGTGKYFEIGDNEGADTPIQSFYGIRDNDSHISEIDRSILLEQMIITELFHPDGGKLRVTSANSINWDIQRGWFMDLVAPVSGNHGERVVSAPLLRHGRVIFTTLIPLADPCAAGGTSWIMELDALTGSRLDYSVFDANNDRKVDPEDLVTITVDGEEITVPPSGIESSVGLIKTPAVIQAGEVEYKYAGGSEGEISIIVEKGGDNDLFGRQSWRRLD